MSGQDSASNKDKFLEAIERKRKANLPKDSSRARNPRVNKGQSSGNTQKMFRRKSGPS
jgi:phosphoribosyl-AMP cyclohydrolase